MSSNYKTESDLFRSNFEHIKHKRIVIYGIGRYTATLMPEIPDFNVVGFMDRDQDKIGTLIYGLPILKKEDAEAKADLVIINTVESYWKTIFARIQDIQLPVYYRYGRRASLEYNHNEKLNYWEVSYDELARKTKEYDIVSFDIFDTLFMRKTYLPKDNWDLIEEIIRFEWGENVGFREAREQAACSAKNGYSTLDEIYVELANILNWSEEKADRAKKIELELEWKILVPRDDLILLCKELITMGKEVFFVSDMYLPAEWIFEALKRAKVKCDLKNIWVSCEKKAGKFDGSLWKLYQEQLLKGKKALHIGDNQYSDIANAVKYGITPFYIMSGRDMLAVSSLSKIQPYICSRSESKIMGLIIQKIADSPFALNQSKGKIWFQTPEDFGYCVYGPVINSFLTWLIQRGKCDKINQLIFMARDGYFLNEDYKFFVNEVLKERGPYPKARYLLTSRRIAMVAASGDEDGFEELISFPFNGTFKEYMSIRFGMNDVKEEEYINLPMELTKVRNLVEPFLTQMKENISAERQEYLEYLNSCDIKENSAFVDTWFYGNTQYYLNKAVGSNLIGYYFAVNLSAENRCSKKNKMVPCFQKENDLKAEDCQLLRKALVTEGLLTAPYGMISSVMADGTFKCLEMKENQKRFDIKEKINAGIKNFIKDFWECTFSGEVYYVKPNELFVDKLFGCWLEGGCGLSDLIRDSFWSDNVMVQKREFKIFE